MENDKFVDESWKNSVDHEKEKLAEETQKPDAQDQEFNFTTYLSSLGFQGLVFLGEIPNPVTNKPEMNLPQAQFIIETLAILREKTKGNLTKEEDEILTASIYELQMRFVNLIQKMNQPPTAASTPEPIQSPNSPNPPGKIIL